MTFDEVEKRLAEDPTLRFTCKGCWRNAVVSIGCPEPDDPPFCRKPAFVNKETGAYLSYVNVKHESIQKADWFLYEPEAATN